MTAWAGHHPCGAYHHSQRRVSFVARALAGHVQILVLRRLERLLVIDWITFWGLIIEQHPGACTGGFRDAVQKIWDDSITRPPDIESNHQLSSGLSGAFVEGLCRVRDPMSFVSPLLVAMGR